MHECVYILYFFLIVSGYYPCPSLSWKDESDDKTMWQSGINNESLLLKAGINIDALLNQDYHKIIWVSAHLFTSYVTSDILFNFFSLHFFQK